MRGSCLCGSVEFEVALPLRPVILCHCTQCRKTSGHVWAATSVPHSAFRLVADAGLVWYRSSVAAQRGFCKACGASLFWWPDGQDTMHFAPGALNGPTGLHVAESWHEADAGDYYTTPPVHVETLHGNCLCGANRFSMDGPMGEVTACHCGQCRKLSGHFAASFDVDEAALHWQSRRTAEYQTPGGGQRGFCTDCGSSLYFRMGRDFSVEAGAVDNPTGGHLARHIFCADKGDYYDLTDGLPQSAQA